MLFRLIVLLLLPLAADGQLVIASFDDVKSILMVENNLRPSIEEYINEEMARIVGLRDAVQVYVAENDALMANSSHNPVPNPFTAWKLMRSMRRRWAEVQGRMSSKLAEQFVATIERRRGDNYVQFPTQEDVEMQARAILRLQDVFALTPAVVAEGRVPDVKGDWVFDNDDCVFMTDTAYRQDRFDLALVWSFYTIKRMEADGTAFDDGEKRTFIAMLEQYSGSLFRQGYYQLSLRTAEYIISIDPGNKFATDSHPVMAKECVTRGLPTDLPNDRLPDFTPIRIWDDTMHAEAYERLCREGSTPPSHVNPDHFCYLKRDHPYLWLAPLHTEIVATHPLALVFRDIISDEESAVLIDVAKEQMVMARIVDHLPNGTSVNIIADKIRIAKNSWISPFHNKVSERLFWRTHLMTNLEVCTAEHLQMGNYGLGGHYRPHYDMTLQGSKGPGNLIDHPVNRNRIATVLFYFSEPEVGGATVFPKLGVAVPPTKNDALFWHNIHRSGENNLETLHAGCPVLSGQKWVANMWLHEGHQEFRRKCSLDDDEGEEEMWLGFKDDHSAYCRRFDCWNAKPHIDRIRTEGYHCPGHSYRL